MEQQPNIVDLMKSVALFGHVVYFLAFYAGLTPSYYAARHNLRFADIALYFIKFPLSLFVIYMQTLRIVLFLFSLLPMIVVSLVRRFTQSQMLWGGDEFTGYFWAIYSLEYNSAFNGVLSDNAAQHKNAIKTQARTIGEHTKTINQKNQELAQYERRIEYLETIIANSNTYNLVPRVYMSETYQTYTPLSASKKSGKGGGQNGRQGDNQPRNDDRRGDQRGGQDQGQHRRQQAPEPDEYQPVYAAAEATTPFGRNNGRQTNNRA
jgi:hypothetical protein